MKPTIKALMMVSILLLAIVCVFEAANAQPRDRSEVGFNQASAERAGPVLSSTSVFAIESFELASCTTSARIVAVTRETPKLDDLNSPINTTSATREAYAKRSPTRAAGYVLRE